MIDWRIVLPVMLPIPPVQWTPEVLSGPIPELIGRIEFEVQHRWVPYDECEPHYSDGHRIGLRWDGPNGESGETACFVTQEFFTRCGPSSYPFIRQDVGHDYTVLVSVAEVDEELGDNPLDVAAFRVSVHKGNGEIVHMPRLDSLYQTGEDAKRFSPDTHPNDDPPPCSPDEMLEVIKTLLSIKRSEEQ